MLSSLYRKYKLVLVASRPTLSSIEEELEYFKIRRFFDLIVTREVAARYHEVEDIPFFPFREQRAKLYVCSWVDEDRPRGYVMCRRFRWRIRAGEEVAD